VTRNDWIEWAEGCWTNIRETDTLNTKEAKGPEDVRHICALQLSVIRRLIKLYTNPGEIVLSPFAGIGSEGWEALQLGRRFYGVELKREYYETACKNLTKAEKRTQEGAAMDLFAYEVDPKQEVVDVQ
jgi:DNA modification methylase